jgi:hypothetical protein
MHVDECKQIGCRNVRDNSTDILECCAKGECCYRCWYLNDLYGCWGRAQKTPNEHKYFKFILLQRKKDANM